MTDRIPARTNKGRDVLLDRNIELDTKLRTVLAQCDGKRDAEQIKARFGNIVDVDAALLALRELGLVEQLSAAAAAPAPQATSVLEAALGAYAGQRMVAATSAAPSSALAAAQAATVETPIPAAPAVAPPVPAAAAAPVVAPPSPQTQAAVAPATPEVEPDHAEVDDDPFAEWFPASMRKPKDRAA